MKSVKREVEGGNRGLSLVVLHLTLTRLEVFKLTHRLRSYMGPGALAVMAGLMVLGLSMGHPPLDASLSRDFITAGNFVNAGFVTWFMLRAAIMFFLPLFACVVTGDMISSESTDGTLRTVLSRPVGRGSVYAAKYAVSALYVIVLTFFMGVAAYAIGSAFLGRGALVTFQDGTMIQAQGIYIFNEKDALIRLVWAYALGGLGVLSVASIAFFLSAIVSNSLGAAIGAMITLILFQITKLFDFFEPIQKYLFTTHLYAWNWVFVDPIPRAEIIKSMEVLLAYAAAFFIAGFLVFRRKDVLS